MNIDIWSDVVCPWCAIGRSRLDAALADFPHADQVEVNLRSFDVFARVLDRAWADAHAG
jgi:predicted DsbA family dithiol-disulfide isomerase